MSAVVESLFRRWLTVAVWVVLGTAVAVTSSECAPAADTQVPGSVSDEEWKLERRQAAHRQRRIIFNNDGCDAVYKCDEATAEALLECRTAALVGTQVDTIFYCTWCSGFSNFTHRTKIGHIFTSKGEQLANNKVDQFVAQGTDPLEIMVDFCKSNEIEIFWSFRMNDTHDGSIAWYGPHLFPQLKKDHPDWLLGSRQEKPKHGSWTAVDYGRQEIRELAFRYVEEVCRNYDVDGVELDFFRHLNYFKSVAGGGHALDAERDMMTGLLGRIRLMTEDVGRRRGRPILVATRVPDSIEYCAAMGLDLVGWLEDDLIDVLVTGGYFRLNPWEVSVELGHRYDVPVYPCLSESRITTDTSGARKSLACYRARALNARAAGADGVYIFNVFDPHKPLWSELGDPQRLRTMDKVFTTGARDVRKVSSYLADGTDYLNRRPLSPDSPRALKAGVPVTVELRVGQELAAQGAADDAPDVKLRLLVSGLAEADSLSVCLNDEKLSGGTVSGKWFECPVRPHLVDNGVNRFQVTQNTTGTAISKLEDLQLWVKY